MKYTTFLFVACMLTGCADMISVLNAQMKDINDSLGELVGQKDTNEAQTTDSNTNTQTAKVSTKEESSRYKCPKYYEFAHDSSGGPLCVLYPDPAKGYGPYTGDLLGYHLDCEQLQLEPEWCMPRLDLTVKPQKIK